MSRNIILNMGESMYGMDTRASLYFPEGSDTDNSVSELILLITYYTVCAVLLYKICLFHLGYPH